MAVQKYRFRANSLILLSNEYVYKCVCIFFDDDFLFILNLEMYNISTLI